MLIRSSAAVIAGVAGLACGFSARAQTIPWSTGVAGNWSDTGRWTGGNVPDAPGESALINASGAYTVNQNAGSLTLEAISIDNPNVTLTLNGSSLSFLGTGLGNSGLMVQNVGTSVFSGSLLNRTAGRIEVNANCALALASNITNNGTLTINPNSAVAVTTLRIDGPITVGGSGSIVLNALSNRAQVVAGSAGVLTLGPNQTLRGYGLVSTPLVNRGRIDATVTDQYLVMNSSGQTNNGLITASNGGFLQISGVTLTQGATGLIEPNGGQVDLVSAGVTGGTIGNVGASRVRTTIGTSVLTDTTLVGEFDVLANTAAALAGTFTNEGTLTVNPTAAVAITTLRIDGSVSLVGSGDILLNALSNRAQIVSGAAGLLNVGPAQEIHGYGIITTPFVNSGLIDGDTPGQQLVLNGSGQTNNALARASAGGTLQISSVTLSQGPTGILRADGGTVELSSGRVAGGTIETAGLSTVRSVVGTSLLSDVESTGRVEVMPNTAIALEGGTFTNNGTLVVNPSAAVAVTTLRIDGPLTIEGTGDVLLNGLSNRAQIAAGSGGLLTIGPAQTIHGHGNTSMALVNTGLIDADVPGQPLQMNTTGQTNNGLIRATNGGRLEVSGITLSQGASGVLRAQSGSVDLINAALAGGTIESSSGERLASVIGTSTLSNLRSTGNVHVMPNTAIALSGAITNDGSLVVNPSAAVALTTLRIDGAVVIDGAGEVVLNGLSNRAQIVTGTDGALTLGAGQTLKGSGLVAIATRILGAVSPGIGSLDTMQVSDPSVVLTYENSSSLDVELGSPSAYDRLSNGSHTINGGTVNVTLTGGYTPSLFTKHTIIDGVSGSIISGRFDGITGPALPPPLVWTIGYTTQDVVVGVSCPSDHNADFVVDILDFLDFFEDFGACENHSAPCGSLFDADYNGDTFVDILDFLDFLDAFGNGC